MKRLLFFCLSFFCLFSPSYAEDRTPTKYAVLIGVDDYARLLKLRYAKKDAEALRDRLIGIGFEKENVFCLTCGGQTKDLPTKEHIEVVLETVFDMAREGDVIILAMCGHGIEVGNEARFCPMDVKNDDLIGTTIRIDDVFENFGKCKATFKLMLVDACRENPFRGRSMTDASVLQSLADPPKGIMLLQSCAKGEISYEDETLQHGVFTHYLLEGLDGKAAVRDGRVTLLGLASYTIEQTQRRVLREYRARQRPYLKGEITDFVLVDTFDDLKALGNKKRDSMDRTPLQVASSHGQTHVVNFLLSQNADIEAKDLLNWTPLHYAVYFRHKDVVKALLEKGADANSQTKDDRTPLHLVCLWNVKQDFACRDDRHTYPKVRYLPCGNLVVMAENFFNRNRFIKMQVVLQDQFFNIRGHRADLENRKKQPITSDAERKTLETMEKLLDAIQHQLEVSGPQLDAMSNEVEDFMKTGDSLEKAHYKTFEKHKLATMGDSSLVELAELLLNHGAKVNTKDGMGNTSLDLAIKGDFPEMVELLKSKGAKVTRIGNTTNE